METEARTLLGLGPIMATAAIVAAFIQGRITPRPSPLEMMKETVRRSKYRKNPDRTRKWNARQGSIRGMLKNYEGLRISSTIWCGKTGNCYYGQMEDRHLINSITYLQKSLKRFDADGERCRQDWDRWMRLVVELRHRLNRPHDKPGHKTGHDALAERELQYVRSLKRVTQR